MMSSANSSMMSSAISSLTATAQLKPCSICNGDACIVIPSIASQQHLCLLHYYTTGAHNRSQNSSMASTTGMASKKKSSSLLVENQRIQKQLPIAQELFAEAFLELQKEIGEESARAFQSAADADDPLALLLDSTSTASSTRSAISRSFQKQRSSRPNAISSNKKKSHEGEGGFLREAVLPERLRKLQNPNVSLEGFASKYNEKTKAAPRNRPATKHNPPTTNPSNPYKRKQNPPTNVWNHVLDSEAKDDDKKPKSQKKTRWEDIEKEMINNITSGGSNASTKKCACGSTKVEINGNVTSRNNLSMTKGEVWGTKDRAEAVVERCYCTTCGKTWNEE